jgi:asparagine synthase (glutamine-hydrolysing)
MGGIAGVVYPDPYQLTGLIEPMLAIQSHRGPEGNSYTYRNVELGSRGSVGCNERRTTQVVCDAFLTNQSELREALRQAGYTITDHSMSSLIAHAYDHWGLDFIKKLDGDFSIALLDQSNETLYLFRDRVGRQPLFWVHDNNHLLFASELKGILATGAVSQTAAVDALATYLSLGYIPQDTTCLVNVNKLLPGHYLKFKLDGRCRIHPYWSCSAFFAQEEPTAGEALAPRLDYLLSDATRRRIQPEGGNGCVLSGGIGSSATAHYVRRAAGEQTVGGYTVVFEGQNEDDLQAASMVGAALELEHQSLVIEPGSLLKDLSKIVWHLEEPLGDPNVLATWRMAELAKRSGATTIFSGMGSDELMGGHQRYHIPLYHYSFTRWLAALPRPVLHKMVLPFIGLFSDRLATKVLRHTLTNQETVAFLKLNSLFRERDLYTVAPNLARYFNSDVFLQRFYQMVKIKSAMASTQYFDMKTRMPDLYITQYERLTAAHGMRWHTPFLDHHVIEFLAGVPTSLKSSDETFALPLQRLLTGTLPSSVLNRPKIGRPNFLKDWARSKQMMESLDMIATGQLVEAGFISKKWIRRQLDRPPRGPQAFQKLWAVLMLEVWFRLFINNPIAMHPPRKR